MFSVYSPGAAFLRFGGAASTYPYGPRYMHYINIYDPVPLALGLGPQSQFDRSVAGAAHR